MDRTTAIRDLAPTDEVAASVRGGAAITIPVPDIPLLNLSGQTIVLVPGVIQVKITSNA